MQLAGGRTRRSGSAGAERCLPTLDRLPGKVPQRFPKPSEISAALAALGVYAQAPTARELAEQALAAVSWALTLMLQAMCLAEPAGSSAVEATAALAEARADLLAAERHLHRLDEQMPDLAGELQGVIAAAEDAMRAHGNGHAD